MRLQAWKEGLQRSEKGEPARLVRLTYRLVMGLLHQAVYLCTIGPKARMNRNTNPGKAELKLKVEIKKDPAAQPVFVEIHCTGITPEIGKLERYIKRFGNSLTATDNGEHFNVPVDDILYIESVDKKTFIYTDTRTLMSEKRLYELEELLDRRDFFRCSKSVILHLNKVERLKPEITRNILATLVNGERVVVSRRYAPELKKLLGIG